MDKHPLKFQCFIIVGLLYKINGNQCQCQQYIQNVDY